MAKVGSLVFELAADVASLRKDMAQAKSTINSALDSMKGLFAAAGVTFGAAMALNLAKSFASQVGQAIENADAMGKLAERLGTTTEAMSALKLQASYADIELSGLTTSMQAMAKALVDGMNPASQQAAAFRALGLSVVDLKNKDPAQAMADIAEAMSGFQDGADKVAVARVIFGRTGAELIPMLNEGAKGFADARAEAEAFGITIDSRTAKAADEFGDNLTRLKAAGDAFWQSMAAELLPTLQGFAEWAVNGVKEGGGFKAIIVEIGNAASIAASSIIQFMGYIKAADQFAAIPQKFIDAAVSWWKPSAWKGLSDSTQDAMNKAKEALNNASTAATNTRQSYQQFKAGATDAMNGVGNTATDTGKKVLNFNEALNQVAKTGRASKAGIDEFARMLQQLQEELRRTQANGDDMALLLSDPRMATFSQRQRDQLIGLKQASLDLVESQKAAKEEQDEWNRAMEDAVKAQEDHQKALYDLSEKTKDALDPTREFQRQVEMLTEAQQAGMLTMDEFTRAVAQLKEKLGQKSNEEQMFESLKQSIEGWGRSAASTFVDFISGSKDAASSFAEMTASVLRDMAKMIMQKLVFDRIFAWVGGLFNFGSGGTAALGSLDGLSPIGGGLQYGGQRAVGGNVYPGQLYRVNESPFAREFFRPSVPGRVERSGSTDQPMNVAITINTTSNTSDVQGSTSDMIELGKRMALVAKQVIAQERRSGGILAGA